MPRITAIEMLNLPEQPVLRIRRTVAAAEIPNVIGPGYAELGAYLRRLGGEPADVPFVLYRGTDPAALAVELCFPLPAPLPGQGAIEAALLPAETAAFCMYLGDYGQMMPVYEEMRDMIVKKSFVPQDVSREYYYNGPEFPLEQMLTKIIMPCIKA